MRKTYVCALSAGLFASLGGLKAQEQKQELDPVTVTAALQAQDRSRTGRNLTIIDGDRFSQLPVHSIDELLRYLPGLEVQARGPMGSQGDLVLRGATFQQVLVLVDGLRVNDALTGHLTANIPLAPEEIERVEVLKGAASAVYGSDAVGGVVHIITKTFAQRKNVAVQRASFQSTLGQYGLFSINTGGVYSNGRTAVAAGLLLNDANGQQQRGISGFFLNRTASVSASRFIGEHWQVSLRGSVDQRKFAAQNFYTAAVSDTAREELSALWTQAAIRYRTANHQLRLDAGFKNMDDHYAFNQVIAPNKNRSTSWQALLTDQWRIAARTALVTGMQWMEKGIRSNDRGDHGVTQAAGFAVLNQDLGEGLTVSPALRLEWNERSGWELVPQLNLACQAGLLTLRGSAGKTTRDADFTERFNNYNKTTIPGGSRVGNPDLQAETSFSYEAGADYRFGGLARLSVTGFRRAHRNLIDYVRTAYGDMPRKDNLLASGVYDLARNVKQVATNGIEADLQLQKSWTDHRELLFLAGFTWLQSSTSDSVLSFYVSSHARLLTNFTVQYRWKKAGFSFTGLYKDRLAQQAASPAITPLSPRYFVLNGRLDYYGSGNRLDIFLAADNLFDESYSDLLGAVMPGRWLMGGIKISLSKL